MLIEHFLETAELGGLHLGVSPSLVRSLLGPPKDWSEGRPEIWRYGGLQLAFHEDELCFIGLYLKNGVLDLPSPLLEGDYSRFPTALQGFENLFKRKRWAFAIDLDLTFDHQKTLRLSNSGVAVCFVDGLLHSIQLVD